MLRQIRTQKQLINVLPQQIQLLKLFHLPTAELQQRIQEELNENPFLEENLSSEVDGDAEKDLIQDYQDEEEYKYDDIPDYKTEHNNYLSDHNLPHTPIANRYNFRNDLKDQLRYVLSNPEDLDLADYLVDSLNGSGLLEQATEEICDDYSFKKLHVVEPYEIERIRAVLKELEPAGAGCLTIKEFLIFQLTRMNADNPVAKTAILFLENYFNNSSHRKTEISVSVDQNELKVVLQLIRRCKRRPIDQIDSMEVNDSLIPDFVIRRVGESYEINLYNQRSATLFINQSISGRIGEESKINQATLLYLKNKLNSAQWFVDAIKQRESTMQKVMRMIVEFQTNYFKAGDVTLLKPMILKNITDRTGVDISTVSRITCNKYADTHFGVILLKDLFSEGIENLYGESVSNRVIQSALSEILKKEDTKSKLTDIQLVGLLAAKGFKIARRTVTKYRERLRIPSAPLRGMLVS
jgi:RNA polymerase sigma-54 factor